eukprot:sb/3473669/
MEVEVLQQQLERARDNLRSVEEGIRKTGLNRGFREETGEEEDEPPVKKALSSVARLGPLPVPKKNSEDEEDEEEEGETTENDAPSLMSAVTCPVLNRDSASSVVSDSKNLNRLDTCLFSFVSFQVSETPDLPKNSDLPLTFKFESFQL